MHYRQKEVSIALLNSQVRFLYYNSFLSLEIIEIFTLKIFSFELGFF